MKSWVILILVVMVHPLLWAQDSRSPIIEVLARSKGTVNVINQRSLVSIPNLPPPFTNNKAKVVKTPAGLFAAVDFSGRLYKLDTSQSTWKWQRVDSTYFSGYNSGNILFHADNKIWSFGGAGLWQITGHLRYFSNSKFEWEIKPLNIEIPHIAEYEDAYWFDKENEMLYLIPRHFPTPAVRDNTKKYEGILGRTWRLDIKKGEWESMGTSKDTTVHYLANSPWGVFYIYNYKPRIVDFKNNEYLKGVDGSEEKVARFSRALAKELVFFRDSTLYFGNEAGYIDSIRFSRSDFVGTGVKVYKPERKGMSSKVLVGSIIAVVGLVMVVGMRKRKNPVVSAEDTTVKKEQVTSSGTEGSRVEEKESWRDGGMQNGVEVQQENVPATVIKPTIKELLELLEERERSLLEYIYGHTMEGRMVSIDEINRQLGVQQKPVEVQKKQRSAIITAINQKLAIYLRTKVLVIDKRRTAFDKRSFEYFVNRDVVE